MQRAADGCFTAGLRALIERPLPGHSAEAITEIMVKRGEAQVDPLKDTIHQDLLDELVGEQDGQELNGPWE